MKVTIFTKSEFFGNIVKHEVTLVEHGTSPYAQYSAAPFVRFKKKRGRIVYGIRQTYQPFLCIVEGWDLNINPDDMTRVISQENGVTVSQSRYMSFDSRFVTDFEAMLNSRKDLNIIALYK